MEVFSGGQENIMETKLNLLSSREVEAGGQRRGVMDRRMKQIPGWVAGVMGILLGSTQPGYAMLTLSAPPACPLLPTVRMEKRGEEGLRGPHWCRAQREVMSLSALSSSSLMALYFIFCA